MFNLQLQFIKEKLHAIDFQGIARRSGFDNRYSKKIRAFDFLFGFLMMYSHKQHSLEAWASCIEQVTGQVVSKQAVALKFSERHVRCFRAVVAALLGQRIGSEAARWGEGVLFSFFRRVLVQDSTCWSLSKPLARFFPGSYSHSGQAATARLQVCYDLKEERFEAFTLQSYRDNDQKHAPFVENIARAGDLVLRDLGYFVVKVFAALDAAGVFFLSRLRYGVGLYDVHTSSPIDLPGRTRGQEQLEMDVLLGCNQQLRVRLVGVKVPTELAAQRRRRAKQDRHKAAHHSQHYLKWLDWNFFVTNVPARVWNGEQVYRCYRLRWRIEMIFKGLKSGLHWAQMFKQKVMPPNRVVLTVYAMLIFVLMCMQCFRWFARQLHPQGDYLSLLKFVHWFRIHFERILAYADLGLCIASVRKHCLYEKRIKRKHYYELSLL